MEPHKLDTRKNAFIVVISRNGCRERHIKRGRYYHFAKRVSHITELLNSRVGEANKNQRLKEIGEREREIVRCGCSEGNKGLMQNVNRKSHQSRRRN
jgi:hypothetical protein